MENSLLVALTRQDALSRQMGVISNNIANMNTTAFKGEKMMFAEYLFRSRGGEKIFGDKISFVRDVATVRNTAAGPLDKTGNPLDIAIKGDGYFVIDTKDGERFSRNGHFSLDKEGKLVTQSGDPVLSDNGEPFFLSTQDNNVTIARDGTISTENGILGRIRVVKFDKEQEMKLIAAGLYTTKEPPQDIKNPDLVQGMLESSNIQPIYEITRMIEVNRAYSAAKLFIDKEDERIKKMVAEVSRPI